MFNDFEHIAENGAFTHEQMLHFSQYFLLQRCHISMEYKVKKVCDIESRQPKSQLTNN